MERMTRNASVSRREAGLRKEALAGILIGHTQLRPVKSTIHQSWPQFFITHICAADDLPDLEILTLPVGDSPGAIDLEELRGLAFDGRLAELKIIGGAEVKRGSESCVAALRHLVRFARREPHQEPWDSLRIEGYAEKIYSGYLVPVI